MLGAASETIELNLIDRPHDGSLLCEPFGFGIYGLVRGLSNDFTDGADGDNVVVGSPSR